MPTLKDLEIRDKVLPGTFVEVQPITEGKLKLRDILEDFLEWVEDNHLECTLNIDVVLTQYFNKD